MKEQFFDCHLIRESIPSLSRVNNLHVLCLTLQLLCPYHINLGLFLIIQREEKHNFITRITIKSVPDVICLSFPNMWVSHACQQAGCHRELQHTNPRLSTRGEFCPDLASSKPKSTGDRGSERRRLGDTEEGFESCGT